MTSYNVNFELSVEDVDLIETALRLAKQELSNELIANDMTQGAAAQSRQAAEENLRRIQDLLGHLHNQKIFYRPRSGAYVGG